MNLADSLRVVVSLFGQFLARERPSKHLGSKRPRLSNAASRERRKRQREARRRQRLFQRG